MYAVVEDPLQQNCPCMTILYYFYVSMPDTLVGAIVDDLCQKQQEPENWEPNISTSTTYREHLSFISGHPLYLHILIYDLI